MKKLIYLGRFVILVLCLTCCNKQIFDFKYTYDKAVCNYDGDKFILEIDKCYLIKD